MDCKINTHQSQISSIVSEWMQVHNVPGCSVAISSDSKIIFEQGYGVRDRNSDLPATPDTLYGVGSCTKSLTAIAILRLCQQNRISLNDKLSDYLSYYQEVNEEITIQEILSHSSGMPSDGYLTGRLDQLTGRIKNKTGPPLATNTDFKQHVKNSSEYHTTKKSFRYYNTGYILLGEVIEHISNTSYSDYINENILAPIGVDRAYFLDESDQIRSDSDVITPYISREDTVVEGDFYFDSQLNSAGGLFIPVTQLLDILNLLLYQGTNAKEQILTESLFDEILSEKIIDAEYIDGSKRAYGYGIRVQPFEKDSLISHTGSMAVSSAWMGGLIDKKLALVVACNTAPKQHPKVVGKTILAEITDNDPSEVVYQNKNKTILSDIVGKYASQQSIVEATVEKCSTGIQIIFNHTSNLGEYVAFPEDTGDYSYFTILDSGQRMSIQFKKKNNKIFMHFGRWILEQDQ